jgi:hypothetical protein
MESACQASLFKEIQFAQLHHLTHNIVIKESLESLVVSSVIDKIIVAYAPSGIHSSVVNFQIS